MSPDSEDRPLALRATSVTKSYGSVVALQGVDLDVRAGEIMTLLGPSGSGKTTLLKVIAGFEDPDAGRVLVENRDITELSPSRRDIGMVFQNYALFPHMTVGENVAFPLRMRGWSRWKIRERVESALDQVELSGYVDRYPKQLSGGQQQRVALARAVVFDPPLLLLDEPFGALDRKLRESMQVEMRLLQQRLGLSTLFVTHDQEEALILSDRIAVMSAGKIEQMDTPDAIYQRPANWFVADFIGESNLLRCSVIERSGDLATVRLESGDVFVAECGIGQATGEAGLLLRPEGIRRRKGDEGGENSFVARVVNVIYLGQSQKLQLELESGLILTARWSAPVGEERPQIGDRVGIFWDPQEVRLLPLPQQ